LIERFIVVPPGECSLTAAGAGDARQAIILCFKAFCNASSQSLPHGDRYSRLAIFKGDLRALHAHQAGRLRKLIDRIGGRLEKISRMVRPWSKAMSHPIPIFTSAPRVNPWRPGRFGELMAYHLGFRRLDLPSPLT